MTVRYCGPGGNNTNDGLSWANRKLTLNGVEDTPVASGDIVYAGPGTYREMLTCDVSGASAITYIADVTGEHTDGVGGIVRVTASDNDIATVRDYCITALSKNYRTFRGFSFDMTGASSSRRAIYADSPANWVIEDCSFSLGQGVYITGASQSAVTIRRCIFRAIYNAALWFSHTVQVVAAGHLVENCYIEHGFYALESDRVQGITLKNCAILYTTTRAIYCSVSTAATQVTVNNCIFHGTGTAFWAANVDQIVEDYNALYVNGTDRTNTNIGANSNTYQAAFAPPLLLAGYKYPAPAMGELAPWSPLRAITGATPSTDDLYGLTKPTTEAKRSWGAVQFSDVSRSTTQTYNTSTASLKLADAGVVQFRVPVTGVSTTIACRVYREANYAGTLPQMVIKQPGQSDTTITDTGNAATWNQLTTTLTPAASPGYVVVELQSLNTATTGSYNVYFDSLGVS